MLALPLHVRYPVMYPYDNKHCLEYILQMPMFLRPRLPQHLDGPLWDLRAAPAFPGEFHYLLHYDCYHLRQETLYERHKHWRTTTECEKRDSASRSSRIKLGNNVYLSIFVHRKQRFHPGTCPCIKVSFNLVSRPSLR